jgi:hypothetical protein
MRDAAAEVGQRLPTVLRANPYRRARKKRDRRVDLVLLREGLRHRVRVRSAERIFDEPLDLDGHPAAYSNHAGVLVEAEVVREVVAASSQPPDLGAMALAAQLLRKGRIEAERRQLNERTASCLVGGLAGLAALGGRVPQLKRRRFLRLGLRSAALVALTPGVGLSILSEGFRSGEIHAFDDAAARLAKLERIADSSLPS